MIISGVNLNSNQKYENLISSAQRDLIIKKIAFAIITTINFAIVLGAFAYVVYEVSLPTKPLLVASFVLGLVGAGFALIGKNVKIQGSSPTSIASSILNRIFFGPTVYLYNKIDWTPYHDPMVANGIYEEIKHFTFEEFEAKYGLNFGNLVKYGFIDQRYRVEIKGNIKKYQKLKETLSEFDKQIESVKNKIDPKDTSSSFLVQRGHLLQELEHVEAGWKNCKELILRDLPRPLILDKVRISPAV